MVIDSNTGTVVTLPEAIAYVTAFRSKFPNETKAFFVGSDKLDLILNQPGCIGVRIYNGCDDQDGNLNQVLVGVRKDGEDIAEGIILEKLAPCPRICSPNSPLNLK